jgi:hypothetical protein
MPIFDERAAGKDPSIPAPIGKMIHRLLTRRWIRHDRILSRDFRRLKATECRFWRVFCSFGDGFKAALARVFFDRWDEDVPEFFPSAKYQRWSHE